ncbi:MAG: DNRLRE domain-containing protein [Phycisphaerales bacterium]|nr:DNRLRE domain-containing protein [Phycisphaerales bacterium]
MVKYVAFAVCGLAVAAGAGADELTFKADKDNTLYETGGGPPVSNGAGGRMFAGVTATGLKRRAVVVFDLAEIPAGSTINSVTLELHMSMSISGSVPMTVHRVLADWGEGTSVAGQGQGGGAPATAGDATWDDRFYPGQTWITPGGEYEPEPSGTTQVGSTGTYQWSGPSLVIDVQGWVDAPASCFGWLIAGDESASSTAKAFDTHENTDPNARPRLIVDFTPPGACYPDCNGDHALNLSDFGCFTTKFALGDPYADCNGDGVRNLSDFGCFTTKFALGCP